jgi:hypothetical protein
MAQRNCEVCGYGMAAKAPSCAYCRKRPEFVGKQKALAEK